MVCVFHERVSEVREGVVYRLEAFQRSFSFSPPFVPVFKDNVGQGEHEVKACHCFHRVKQLRALGLRFTRDSSKVCLWLDSHSLVIFIKHFNRKRLFLIRET